MIIKGDTRGQGINYKDGINKYKLFHITQIFNKDLCIPRKGYQHSLITYRGKEAEHAYIYMYMYN